MTEVMRYGWTGRRRFGSSVRPIFYEYKDDVGLKVVNIEFQQWAASFAVEPATGNEELKIVLTGVGSSVAELAKQLTLSHVKIGRYFYEFLGVAEQLGNRNNWYIRCKARGEHQTVAP